MIKTSAGDLPRRTGRRLEQNGLGDLRNQQAKQNLHAGNPTDLRRGRAQIAKALLLGVAVAEAATNYRAGGLVQQLHDEAQADCRAARHGAHSA